MEVVVQGTKWSVELKENLNKVKTGEDEKTSSNCFLFFSLKHLFWKQFLKLHRFWMRNLLVSSAKLF